MLSIGIPTKNRVPMLSQLLDDIENCQPDIPVVISDNSDRNETALIVEQYAKKLNIKYIHVKSCISQAENFNSVIQQASTKYVVIMHDDDRFTPTSIATYQLLVSYIEEFHNDMLGVYVMKHKFTNEKDLNRIFSQGSAISDFADIEKNLKVFSKKEYQAFFLEKGVGGGAPGMLVNRHLLIANSLYFPTDTGAKHDKAFFLTANAIGPIGCWQKKTIAKRLHESSSIHRKVTENYYLFNQKILEIYENDLESVRKIHKNRIRRWMADKPGFKIDECYYLIRSSQLTFLDGIELLAAYSFYGLRTFALFSKRFK